MRSDHTTADLTEPQPAPGPSLENAAAPLSRPPMRMLTRVAFCFAWLFGLEPFLSAASEDSSGSKRDSH
ncbi:hypothetical protein LJ656_29385 [Paraburkholderia sp. MMS20-SJTR3]|uniref:Uncharacterized protein n=1 Tax=Paraburkholderia sejongensis TaxID=2886946 RepID=A0ABS8K3H1_9BURK|nr:hypothetical protein [Paraburkholderia sp. MMS20-SJTR3]MCC8396710.1 hypothetical protein [Paraburkholderia sp. MMS20-SJTR3]